MLLHERIRAVRKAKGVTQTHLAKQLGYTSTHYSTMENGNYPFNEKLVPRIAKILNVSVSEFDEKQ